MDKHLEKAMSINQQFQKNVSNLAFSHKNLMEETHDMMDLHKPSGLTGLTVKIEIKHPDGKVESQVGFVNGSNVFLPIRKSVNQNNISKTLVVRFQTEKDTDRKITLGNTLHILLDEATGKPILLYKGSGVPDLGNLIHPPLGDSSTRMEASKLAGQNVFVNSAFQDTQAKLEGCGYLPSDMESWTKAGNDSTMESWTIGQCQTTANRAGAKSFLMGSNPWQLNVFDSQANQYKGADELSQVSGTYTCGNASAPTAVVRQIEGKNTLVVTTTESPINVNYEIESWASSAARSGFDTLMWPVFVFERFYLGALWKNDGGRYERVLKWCLMADGCSSALATNCKVGGSRLVASKTGVSPIGEYCGGNIFVLLTSTCYYKKEESTGIKHAGLPVSVPISDAGSSDNRASNFVLFTMESNQVIMDHDGKFHGDGFDEDSFDLTSLGGIPYAVEFTCQTGEAFPCPRQAGKCEYPNNCTEDGEQCVSGPLASYGGLIGLGPKVVRCPGSTCSEDQNGTLCGGSVDVDWFTGTISGSGWVCKNGRWEDLPSDISSKEKTICTTNNAFSLKEGWGWVAPSPPKPEIYAELIVTDSGQIRIEQVTIKEGEEQRVQLIATKPMSGFSADLLGSNDLWKTPNGDGDGNTPIMGGPTFSPMNTLRSGTLVSRGKYLLSPNGKFRLLFGSVADSQGPGDPSWDEGFLYGFGIVSGTPGEKRSERINNLLAGDKDANAQYDSCNAGPNKPEGLDHLVGSQGIGSAYNKVILQFTAPVCGPRTEVTFDPSINSYVLSANKTKRIIAHSGSSLEEQSGASPPKSIYPVASFAGSLFSNPEAINTGLYNTIYVDEYSIPYVLAPEDTTYKGDFLLMGYYVTGMTNKEECVECRPQPGMEIGQAEKFIQETIMKMPDQGSKYVGFEYDSATRRVFLLDSSLYTDYVDGSSDFPVELYPANVSLGGQTRLYLRKPLISEERAAKLCNSAVFVSSSDTIGAQAGGPYLTTGSINTMPADKQCDIMVDMDVARNKFNQREEKLMGEAKIIGEKVERLDEDMKKIQNYKTAAVKKMNEDINMYEVYFYKVLDIIKNGTTDAQVEASKLSLVNSNYEYVIWSVLAISILMFVLSFKNK